MLLVFEAAFSMFLTIIIVFQSQPLKIIIKHRIQSAVQDDWLTKIPNKNQVLPEKNTSAGSHIKLCQSPSAEDTIQRD